MPIYTTLNIWYGSDKNGTRTKFIRARTTYLQGPSTDKFGTRTTSIRVACTKHLAYSINVPKVWFTKISCRPLVGSLTQSVDTLGEKHWIQSFCIIMSVYVFINSEP